MPIDQSGTERILFAVDARHHAYILATDGQWVAFEMDAVGSSCLDDIGISNNHDDPGLYLWTGTGKIIYYGETDEREVDWYGSVRPIAMNEFEELIAMAPPEQPEPIFPDGNDAESSTLA